MHFWLNEARRGRVSTLATLLFALCCHTRAGSQKVSEPPHKGVFASEPYEF